MATRTAVIPVIHTYHRRTKASIIAPPIDTQTVATDTLQDVTLPAETPSTSHGQKRQMSPSSSPPPSPKRRTETPTSIPDTPPVGHSQGDLPTDLPKPSNPDHAAKALTFNKQTEQTKFDRVSSIPYHPGKFLHHSTLEALGLQETGKIFY